MKRVQSRSKLKKKKKNKKKKKRLDVFPSFSNRVKQQIISLSQLRPSLALPLSLPFSLFLIFFFLFFFFFLLVCTSPKHLYQPKQPDFAGMAGMRPVRPIFFPVRNKGCTCTGALTGMVYIGHSGRYGTELTFLSATPSTPLINSTKLYFCVICTISNDFNL